MTKSPPPDPVVRLRGVTKAFPGAAAVMRGLQFELGAGEYVAVIGESGVGKSTLLNLVAGLDVPDEGTVEVCGIPLAGLGDDAATLLRRRRIGFVFQAFHVLPQLTVLQNVALPLTLFSYTTLFRSNRKSVV